MDWMFQHVGNNAAVLADDHERFEDVRHSNVASNQCAWCEICHKLHNDVKSTAKLQHCVEEQRSDVLEHTEEVPGPAFCARPDRSPAGHVYKQTSCDIEICAMC